MSVLVNIMDSVVTKVLTHTFICVKDTNDKMRYTFRQFNRAVLLKASGDYDKKREKNTPRWRWFDKTHKAYSIL